MDPVDNFFSSELRGKMSKYTQKRYKMVVRRFFGPMAEDRPILRAATLELGSKGAYWWFAKRYRPHLRLLANLVRSNAMWQVAPQKTLSFFR